MATHYGCSY
jgi:hypothetical protein